MKAVQLALLFAVLATAAFGQTALGGLSGGFYVRTGPNNTDCALQFAYSTFANRTVIGQQYKNQTVFPPSPLPEGCSAQNLRFTSWFRNDNLSADDQLVPVSNGNETSPVYNAEFNADWLYRNNGSGCALLPQTSRAGLDQYLCILDYNGTPLYLAVWGNGNFTFDTADVSVQAFILSLRHTQITGASTLVVGFNTSFPNINANLTTGCGSNDTVIRNLGALVTVTSDTDLSAVISGVWLGYSLIKRNNATASGDYIVRTHTSQAALFTSGSGTNGCYSMAVTYNDILPDLLYCADGCKVTFVLRDNNFKILPLRAMGLTTSNSTDNGNGSGNGNGTGNGNGNGNGNGGTGPVSSASSMAFNAALLLISVAYLAWL